MEERQFLHKLCINALQVDDSIEFAGVVDSHGKLLVGKARDIFCYKDYYKKRKNNSFLRFSNSYGKAVFKDKAVSVNNIKSIVSLQSNLFENQTLFKLINLNDKLMILLNLLV